MTCREFKHNAAALTLWEVSRTRNERLLKHADGCQACGTWLQKQHSLASSMRTLQVQAAGLEAGPYVEQALLKEFRRATAARAALPAAAMPLRSESLPSGDRGRVMPMAIRLSRFFEIGAYAAVAAAIVVGVFLGTHLLEHRSRPMTSQVASAPASATPVAQKPVAAEPNEMSETSGSSSRPPAVLHSRVQRQHPPASDKVAVSAPSAVPEASQTSVDDGYVALMFCDPFSCSSDSQVVRMELPAASQDAQPQIADVVVGYDGLVRAVRIVN